MRRGTYLCAAALACATALSGCWESSDVTVHRQGTYKGAMDPLLDKEATAKREDILKKRFQLVQVDR